MIPGCTYTVFSGDTTALPVMTGHALTESAARRFVEMLMTRDLGIFAGIVRQPTAGGAVHRCARSRQPGQFVWVPSAVPAAASSWAARLAS